MRFLKLLVTLVTLFSINPAWATERKVEVSVLNALIPSVGYDDNDSIEAVLTGELPSPCFSLAEATVEQVGKDFRVRQYAWMRTDGLCGSGDLIDDPVSFTSEVNLGKVSGGNYLLNFNPEANRNSVANRSKGFAVALAPVSQIDTFNYAATTNAVVTDYQYTNKRVYFTLSGVISSRCAKLKEPVEVKLVDDVFVVLPVLEPIQDRNCERTKYSFQKRIDLGMPKPGEYLIHIRSRNGKAINRVFTVLKPWA